MGFELYPHKPNADCKAALAEYHQLSALVPCEIAEILEKAGKPVPDRMPISDEVPTGLHLNIAGMEYLRGNGLPEGKTRWPILRDAEQATWYEAGGCEQWYLTAGQATVLADSLDRDDEPDALLSRFLRGSGGVEFS